MITIQLMGGLGNQLFQIFATIAYALKHSHRFIFPYSDRLVIGKVRPTYWNNFLSNMTVFTTKNVAWKYANAGLNALPIIREPGFHYTEIQTIPSNVAISLNGYYQSYKYFQDYQDKIYAMLLLTNQQIATQVKYANYFTDKKTISMHFRLGDYKEKQHFHPIMPKEYYHKALLHILSTKYSQSTDLPIRVLYFCEKEDNAYVSSVIEYIQNTMEGGVINMREPLSEERAQGVEVYPKMGYHRRIIEFMKVEDDMEDWQQLLLMSCCNDNIIANSTFSWWGAYFNQNADKCVCYPSNWFGPSMGAMHMDDLFPPTWEKIEL
jgi:hypothetical protein